MSWCLVGLAAAAAPATAQTTADSGVTSNGIHYFVSGSAHRPPVVLIHAFSLDHRMWEPQLTALERQFRVIRYDQRGHGRSPLPAGPYSARHDLEAVLDAVGISRAALVGASSGAGVAVDFVLERPDRVTRLVLVGPSVGGYVPQGSYEWMRPVIEAAQAGDARRAAERWSETAIMQTRDEATQTLVRELTLSNADLWTLARNPVVPHDPPANTRLHEIRVPTLILVGERDLADSHAVTDTLTARIAGARRITVPDAGHLVSLAAPTTFTTSVTEFLLEERR